MMHEESGLEPLGHAVLVETYEGAVVSPIIIPESAKQGMKTLETRARIVALGPLVWMDEPAARAVIGDKVFLANFSGTLITGPRNGVTYRMVNDRDVYCRFEEKINE